MKRTSLVLLPLLILGTGSITKTTPKRLTQKQATGFQLRRLTEQYFKAVHYNKINAVHEMLTSNPRLARTCTNKGMNALHVAYTASLVKMLIKHNVKVNGLDSAQRTPLYYAKSPSVVRVLYAAGADDEIFDKQCQTPMGYMLANHNIAALHAAQCRCGRELKKNMLTAVPSSTVFFEDCKTVGDDYYSDLENSVNDDTD